MPYKTYKFKAQDPAIGQVKTMFLEADIKKIQLHRMSGVSPNTIYNWFRGKTRHPRNDTIEATGRALGYQRQWVPYNGPRSK